MEARLYFEAHITVTPFEGADWTWFATLAANNEFRASRFDVDEVDHYDGAWFLSARDKDFDTLRQRIKAMVERLANADHEVIRWKVEDTLLDSKHGDIL